MDTKTKWRYHFLKTFFVINEKELYEYYKSVRRSVITLVHYGFSREEVYMMPIGEMLDYIDIIVEDKKAEMAALDNTTPSYNDDVKMAGNTLPGNVF